MQWTRDFWREIRPRAKGTYLNLMADGEDDESITAAFSPGNVSRLAALKRKYDPANFFRMNHNIRPA